MRRLMVVYNPRSSGFRRVQEEVLDEARKLKGWTVGKFEVADTDVDDNAAKLAKVLSDGDLVVAAGGDGTATIALNGVMQSSADEVKLGVLPYGNFNDMARALGMMSFLEIVAVMEGKGGGRVVEAWGLECLVNGERWRWGMCYVTVGLFAEACAVFDERDNRRELKTGRRGLFYSVWLLVKWYLKNRKRRFLGDFVLNRNGEERCYRGMTDYVAVNGKSMAKMMRGGKWWLDERSFLSETRSLKSFWNLARLMGRSVLLRVPGEETRGDVLSFDEPVRVMIQAEGEYRKFDGVRTVEVRKAERAIRVVIGKRT